MRFVIILALLAGCRGNDYSRTSDASGSYDRVCVDGHVYFRGHYRMAIKLSDEGKPIKCDGDKR